jgi:hypothetical protein
MIYAAIFYKATTLTVTDRYEKYYQIPHKTEGQEKSSTIPLGLCLPQTISKASKMTDLANFVLEK